LGTSFHNEFNFGLVEIFHDCFHPDQRLDMCVYSIRHEVKFSIRWNESDQAFALELVQSHTLMEFDVLKVNQLASCLLACHLEQSLVVEAKLKLWHTTER